MDSLKTTFIKYYREHPLVLRDVGCQTTDIHTELNNIIYNIHNDQFCYPIVRWSTKRLYTPTQGPIQPTTANNQDKDFPNTTLEKLFRGTLQKTAGITFPPHLESMVNKAKMYCEQEQIVIEYVEDGQPKEEVGFYQFNQIPQFHTASTLNNPNKA